MPLPLMKMLVPEFVPVSKGDAAPFAAGGVDRCRPPLHLPLMRFARGRKILSFLARGTPRLLWHGVDHLSTTVKSTRAFVPFRGAICRGSCHAALWQAIHPAAARHPSEEEIFTGDPGRNCGTPRRKFRPKACPFSERGLSTLVLLPTLLLGLRIRGAAFQESPIQPTRGAGYSQKTSELNRTSEVKALIEQGVALIDKDQAKAATEVFRKAVALSPENSSAHYYLGYVLLKEGQVEVAEAELEKSLRLDPTNAYAKYFLARLLQSKGRPARSVRLYESLVAAGNPLYDTYVQLSQLYQRNGQKEQALEALQKAIQQTPLDGAIHYRLGQIYSQLGRSDEARRSFEAAERLKQADQKTIQKTVNLSLAIKDNDADRVAQIREDLLRQSARDPEILIQTGVLLGEGGYYQQSIEPLRMAAGLLPSAFEAHFNLGLSLVQLGNTQEAESALVKALALRPDSFEVNSALAVIYVNQHQPDEAIPRLLAAKRARPDNVKVIALLGQQYLQGRYLQEAIATLSEGVHLKPDDPKLRQLLVSAYQKNKEFDRALSVARESRGLFPSIAQSHFDVGEQLANLGRYQEARPYFEEAIRIDSSFFEAYNSLGDSLLKNGEYQAAFEKFQAARSLEERSLRAARGIGQSLNRLRRHSEAVAELEKSIRVLPDDSQLYFELSQAYMRLGNPDKAKEASSIFEQLRTKEVAKEDAERPRRYELPSRESKQ